MLSDAGGNAVPTNRCICGRHKVATSERCCRECPGTFTGRHAVGCHMRQEHFPDTRRGVFVADHASIRPVGDMTVAGGVSGTARLKDEHGKFAKAYQGAPTGALEVVKP